MLFNPDLRKQATEVYLSRKLNQDSPLPLDFNDNTVQTVEVHNHLGLSLDKKLDFNIHIENKINKCNKMIGIMKRLSLSISRDSLLTIYKSFIRPHLDYADIIYDKPGNVNFESKLERVQYNACLAITGAIRGTNRENIYAELGLESLSVRRWYRKLLFFYKIVHGLSPDYLTAYINFASERSHNTRSSTKIHLEEPICRTKVFQSSFFLYCIKIWNGLDPDLQNIDSYKEFKSKMSPFIKIKLNSIFSVQDVYGVKLLSRLRLNFSHLNKHKARHGFKDGNNCMCDCGSATEAILHFLLQCQLYQTIRVELLNSIYNLNPKIRKLSNDKLLQLLLYRSKLYSFKINREIIKLCF